MFSTVITAAVLYIATAVDLLVILLIFFARANTRKEYRDIYIGQYLGSVILILVSLFLAFVLNYVPEKWVLGLLGLIPIYLGIKVAIYDDCEGEKRAKKELDEKGLSKLVGIVALVTVASCGADNIGLFVPYFVTLDLVDLLVTLLVFLILIFVFNVRADDVLDDDEIEEAKPVNLPDFNTGVDAKAYKQRVEHFIKVNENHITIARLKRGIPLTREDLTRLEQFVYNAQEVAGEQEFKEHFGNEISLPEFIRSLVGLDYQAVKEAFSNYLVNTTYNERQIRFIEMIIDQLTKQGKLQAIRLYEPPFNHIHYEGIDGLFSENDIDKIFNTIDNFNNVLTA